MADEASAAGLRPDEVAGLPAVALRPDEGPGFGLAAAGRGGWAGAGRGAGAWVLRWVWGAGRWRPLLEGLVMSIPSAQEGGCEEAGEGPCNDIVGHDAPAPGQMLAPTDWPGLGDVKHTEEDEGDGDAEQRCRQGAGR